MAHGPSARQRVYLLTVWREDGEVESGSSGLRFTLKDPRTGERRGFASVEALAAALEPKVTAPDAPDRSGGASCGTEASANAQGDEDRDDLG